MKRTFIALMAAAALAGCSKEEAAPGGGASEPDLSAPIEVSAGIDAQVESKAAITGTTFPPSTNGVFALTAYAGATAPTTNWSGAYFDAPVSVNSGTGTPPVLTLATAKYYPTNGNKVYFYAYAPTGGTFTAGNGTATPSVTYTITGQEDIMWASHTTGIAKAASATAAQTQPELNFTHKLKQVKFMVKRDASFEDLAVTKIEILTTANSIKLDVATGTITSSGSATLTAYNNTTGVKMSTTTATAAGDAIMFAPGASFTAQITVGGNTYNVPVTLTGTNAGGAGISHTVTFTFKRNQIVPTAKITAWTAGAAFEGTVI